MATGIAGLKEKAKQNAQKVTLTGIAAELAEKKAREQAEQARAEEAERQRLLLLDTKEAKDKKYALEQELLKTKEQAKEQSGNAGTAAIVAAGIRNRKNSVDALVDADNLKKRKALEKEISDLAKDITLASRIQQGEYVTKRAIEALDFEEYSFEPEIPEQKINPHQQNIPRETESERRYMTDEQRAVYNYYYNKFGKAKAEEYYATIADSVRQKKAEAIFEGNEGNPFNHLLMAGQAGLEQAKAGFQGTARMVLGDDSYQPRTEFDYYSEMAKEDLADFGAMPEWIQKNIGIQSLGTLAYDWMQTGANMAPSVAIGMATAPFTAGLGGALAIGASAGGNTYAETLREGFSAEQARNYAVLSGASEAVLSSLLSGIGALGGKLTKNFVGNLVDVDGVLKRIAKTVPIKMGSEGLEEYLQEILDPIFRNAVLDENNEINLLSPEALYSFILGALSSGGFVAGETAIENYNAKQTYSPIQEELVEQGLESDTGSVSYVLATIAREKIDEGKNLSGRELRRLADANEEAIAKEQERAQETTGETVAENATVDSAEPKTASAKAESTSKGSILAYTGKTAKTVSDIAEIAKSFEYAGKDTPGQIAALYDKNGKASAEEFSRGIAEAYRYGANGFSIGEMNRRGSFVEKLSDAQRASAYYIGQNNAEKAIIAKAQEQQKKVLPGIKGKVVLEGRAAIEVFDDPKQTSVINFVDKVLSKVAGMEYHIFSSFEKDGKRVYINNKGEIVNAPNGWYNPETRQIWIDLHAGSEADGKMLYTLTHEHVHDIKVWSAQHYNKLVKITAEAFERSGKSFEEAVAVKLEQYRKNHPETDLETAREEVVAETMSGLLRDKKGLTEFSNQVYKQDRTLWEKIKDWFKDVIAKITNAYKNLAPESEEARMFMEQKELFEKAQKVFAEAVATAGENYKNAGVEIDTATESVAPSVMFSERTWSESEYVKARSETARAIASELDVPLDKAYDYIDSVNSVAKAIADDRARLDYDPNLDEHATVLKPNSEYGVTVDMSTLCAKRLLTTGTFDAIQKRLPDMVFDSEDIVKLRKMMMDRGYEVACGICYVESTRREMGRITQEFIDRYKIAQQTGKPIARVNASGQEVILKSQGKTFMAEEGYTPNLGELNTTDIDYVKRDHPEVYNAYLAFMNARGQAKPKLLETRAEYKGEILKQFKRKDSVEKKNLEGGLRLQSFSDFELPHLIDMMQIVMDMSRVGLKSQAYTKVPKFAEAFGDTGIKINLSLIAKGKGVDANGNLIFDDIEGINHEEAFRIRERFSNNVGTILVGKNDEHIRAAMADPRIDMIIPFHKSSWKESLYEALGLTGYTDYTKYQMEKPIDKSRGKIDQFHSDEYWDYSKSGDENAQVYLRKCREDGRTPVFPQFQNEPGYWKMLIDFKMYDNDGFGAPHEVVKPVFNNEYNAKILDEYRGGHRKLPVAQDVVEDFVKEYDTGIRFQDRDSDGRELSKEQVEYFKDSKARDAKGRLLTLYHGSDRKVTAFDPQFSDDKTSLFFTNNYEVAHSYTRSDRLLNPYAYLDENSSIEDIAKVIEEARPYYSSVKTIDAAEAKVVVEEFKNKSGDIIDAMQGFLDASEGTNLGNSFFAQSIKSNLDSFKGWMKGGVILSFNPLERAGMYSRDLIHNVNKGALKNPPEVKNALQRMADVIEPIYDRFALAQAYDEGGIIEIIDRFGKKEYLAKSTALKRANFEQAGGILPVYANITNPLVIDAKGKRWNQIEVPPEMEGHTTKTELLTRDVAVFAHDNGYDGVIFKNLVDMAAVSKVRARKSTVVVAFDGKQIKSVDNKTPTSNPDIRYQDRDSDGRQLSKGQVEFFKNSKMRDENGALKVMHHGTDSAGFTIFDSSHSDDHLSLFFSDNVDVSGSYSEKEDSKRFNPHYKQKVETAKDFNELEQKRSFFSSKIRVAKIDEKLQNEILNIKETMEKEIINSAKKIIDYAHKSVEKIGYANSSNGKAVENYIGKLNGLLEKDSFTFGDMIDMDNYSNLIYVAVNGYSNQLHLSTDAKDIANQDNADKYSYAIRGIYLSISDKVSGYRDLNRMLGKILDTENAGEWVWYAERENGSVFIPAHFGEDIGNEKEIVESAFDYGNKYDMFPFTGGNRYDVYLNLENPYIYEGKHEHKGSAEYFNINYDGIEFEVSAVMDVFPGEAFSRTFEEYFDFEDYLRHIVKNKDVANMIMKEFDKLYDDYIDGRMEEDDFEINYRDIEVEGVSNDYWNSLKGPDGRRSNTRDIAKWAYNNGYDGVIFKDIYDNGGQSHYDTADVPSTIAIAFNSNQVKDIDNLNPTEDRDIRYSDRENFVEDKYYARQINRWTELQEGSYITVGKIKKDSPLNMVGIPDDKLYFDVSKIRESMKSHGEHLSADDLEKIPQLLDNPIAITEYKPGHGEKTASVYGNLFTEDGTPIVVGVVITKGANKNTISKVRTIHARKDFKNQITDESILYLSENKKETTTWFRLLGIDVPLEGKKFGFIRILPQNDDYVKHQERLSIEDRNRVKILENKVKRLEGELKKMEVDAVLAGQMSQGKAMAKEMRHKAEAYEKAIAKKKEQISEVRARRDELLEKARKEKAEAVAKVRQEARDRLEKTIADVKAEKNAQINALREKHIGKETAIKEKYRDSIKKATEGRHRTLMRGKIKRVVGELNDLLLHGGKERHVPERMKAAVAKALDVLNVFDPSYYDSRIENLERKIEQEQDPAERAKLKVEHAKILEQREKAELEFSMLKAAYDELGKDGDAAFDPVVAEKIDAVAAELEHTRFKDMSMNQLEQVYELYSMLKSVISKSNKLFAQGKAESAAEVGEKAIAEVQKVGGNHPLSLKATKGIESFFWNNEKPIYAFERIGSGALTDMFKSIRRGEDTWARDVAEAKEFYEKVKEKYHVKAWDKNKTFAFKTSEGVPFELTVGQMMSIYAYSKRKDADKHLSIGGFVFDPKTEVRKGLLKYELNNATAHNITAETILEIAEKLTDEQRAFADEMQDYLSDVMGAKGNEVSMAMYDVKLFREKHYFPLKSANQYLFEQNNPAGEIKLKNSGFTKNRIPGANNPIVLTDFIDVWANHVNDMSMYHSFVLPLEDFNRVYNYKTSLFPNQKSVKGVIQNAYGEEANRYISQLLTDLNGGARIDNAAGFMNCLIGRFKKASVFASASVVIQQPSAIVRARAVLGERYFYGMPKVEKHKVLWEEVKKYAPVAVIKEMGYFDTNMGRSTVDYIKDEKTVMDRIDDKLSRAPAYADEATWCAIWNAVKRETKAKNPELNSRSEEFLEICGERFTEVIVRTQVYDSVLSRSANMRSKDTGMKMATAFMAEPTTSINMLEDAVRQAKRGNRKQAVRTAAAVYGSLILNAALVSLVYAARDDDDDENYLEKYISSFTAEVIDGFNPLTMIPFVKDVISITQGYDVDRADMSLVTRVYDAFEKVMKSALKDTSEMDGEELSDHRKEVGDSVMGLVGEMANLFGIPGKNIIRDIKAAINLYGTLTDAPKASFGSIFDQALDAVGKSVPIYGKFAGKDKNDKLYDAIITGDETYLERIRSGYKDESSYTSAVRKALKESDPRIEEAAKLAAIDEDYAGANAIAKEIIGEGNFDNDVVFKVIADRISAIKGGDDETASSPKNYGMFNAEQFVDSALDGDKTDMEVIRNDFISKKIRDGKTQEEAEKSFTDSVKNEVKDRFESGEISAEDAVEILEGHCGKSRADAESTVEYWNFKNDYPDTYVDDAWFDEYHEEVESSGLDIQAFMEYRNAVKGITGKDKKKLRMEVIDSLPISKAQKDALYYAEGWAKSTIGEAPWR